jgi:putative ABC transport system permease protein
LVWTEQLIHDVRYSWRLLQRDRVFTGIVVLTLAVASGMNTAIFSVFNAVVLRPLAYPQPDALVWLSTVGPEEDRGFVTGPDFVEWRDHASSFDRMVAYGTADYALTTPQGATRVRVAEVTGDFWGLSGAAPASGRLPRSNERDVVLLSHRFAQRWFPGDSAVLGRTVTLSGRQVAIIGILPEPFRFHLPGSVGSARPEDVDVYEPMFVSSRRGGQTPLLSVVGRLGAGATLEGARAELEAIRRRIAQEHPHQFDTQRLLRIVPLHQQIIGGAGWALLVLLGAAGFVLLIACANTASLFLARNAGRRREFAVRMSVGAGRGRLFRQLLLDTLVLTALGTAAGMLLAHVGVAAILRIDPQAIPRLLETTIDGRVLGTVLAASVFTAMTFGLAPAATLWGTDPHHALKGGSRVTSGARAVLRIRKFLVAGQVALALTLLIGAGLLMKSAWRMHAYTPGFEPARVLTATIEFAGPQYSDPQRSLTFADALLERLRTHGAVEAVSISTHGYMLMPDLMVEGDRVPTREELGSKPPIMINASSAALRHVMGFRMLRGRWFEDGEAAAVLNESVARREMGGRDPVGRRIRVSEGGPLLTIVGVVEDLKYSQLDAPAEPEVYVPYRQIRDGLFGFTVLILTSGEPSALAPSVRNLVADIDKTQVPDRVMTLEQSLAESVAPRRLNLFLLGAFAATALLLAVVGIYGVMAYSVTQRLHEIGVRMALGAQRSQVVRMLVRQGMAITSAGILAGLTGALILTRLMESLLYDVRPTDPWTFAVVGVSLATAGFLACSLPALKAAFVDPAITLRDE